MKNMEERDASARHCMMEDADCWQWIEIGPFVGPTLLYGVMAPLTTALGVSIAGHAAGSSSNFGFAIVGATLGMGPAAVLTLAAAYGGDETAYLSLIVGGTLLPALGSVLFHEIGHNAIERRKRVSAFTLQPLATVTSDGRGALIGASGTF